VPLATKQCLAELVSAAQRIGAINGTHQLLDVTKQNATDRYDALTPCRYGVTQNPAPETAPFCAGEPSSRANARAPAALYSHATTLKEMSVYPQPVQKPHPQVWQPIVVSGRTIRETARKGINAVFVASTVERVREEVATYYEEAERHNYPDRLHRGRFKHGWDCAKKRGVCHFQGVHIVDHGIGNMERARMGASHLWDYLSAYVPPGVPSLVPPVVEGNAPSFFGSTQQVIDAFMEIREAGGYEDFLCTAGFTHPGMSREEAEEQMQAFAQDVMPVLKRECGGSPDLPEPEPALQI
jgi:hypothetical protein